MAARQTSPSALERAFERKVRLSQWALQFERLWPRAWMLLGLAGLFIAVSMAGLWPRLPELPHKIVLALFGLAFFAALVSLVRVRSPSRARGDPPRRGRVRHPASSGVLLRGHADAGRRGRAHGGAVARAPRASRRDAEEAAGRPPGAAHRPSRSLCAARPAAAQRVRAHHHRRRQCLRPAGRRLPLRTAGQGRRCPPRCLDHAAGLHRQGACHAGRRRLPPLRRRARALPIARPARTRCRTRAC